MGLSARVSRAAWPRAQPIGKPLSTGSLVLYNTESSQDDNQISLFFTDHLDCVLDMTYSISDGGQITLTSTQIDNPICDSATIDLVTSGTGPSCFDIAVAHLGLDTPASPKEACAGNAATAKNEDASFSLTPGGTGRNVVLSVKGTDQTSCKIAYKVRCQATLWSQTYLSGHHTHQIEYCCADHPGFIIQRICKRFHSCSASNCSCCGKHWKPAHDVYKRSHL